MMGEYVEGLLSGIGLAILVGAWIALREVR